MPDEWSFNLRSCVLGADEDCDSDDDLSPNQLSTDTEFLREIDLSSRQDHAQYKPNPWSIAKVNAASRSKLPTPIRPAILTANTVTKPKGAIVEAFRKQAEKPKPKSTQQFAPVKLPPARVEVEPRSLASRNGAGCQQNASQTPSSSRLVTLTHTPISMDRVTPRSLRMTPTRAVVNHNSKDAHIAADTSFAQRNPAPSLGSHTLCNDLNTAGTPVGISNNNHSFSSAHLYLQKVLPSQNHISPFTQIPPVLRQYHDSQTDDSARASIDRIFKRTANQTSARQYMSSPTAAVQALQSPSHHHHRNTHSSPIRPPQILPIQPFSRPISDPASQTFAQYPTLKRKASAPLISPPRPSRRPSQHPILINDAPSRPPQAQYLRSPRSSPLRIKPTARKDAYDSSPSPDSSWSTFPSKKKGVTSTKKRIKESGAFKLPLSLARGGAEVESRAVGGGSKPRVVTYLPPPPKKKAVVKDASPEMRPGNHGRQLSGLPSPPPSDDPPGNALGSDAPAVEFDTDGVIRRYKVVRQGLRRRKDVSNQLWTMLGLESCGVVYNDALERKQEVGIVSWSGSGI